MRLVCSQVWCTLSSQLFSQVLVNRQGIPHHRRSFSQVQFARNCLVCKHSHMTDVTNVKLIDHHIAVSLLSHFFVFKGKKIWGANIIFSIVMVWYDSELYHAHLITIKNMRFSQKYCLFEGSL